MADLTDVLKRHRTVSLFVHNHPDPDALASAYGLRYYLAKSGFPRVKGVFYSGLIGRAENREMIRLLKIGVRPAAKAEKADLRQVVLVDSQPFTGNVVLPKGAVPVAAIDHHPLRKVSQSLPWCDIRPRYGSCSTIVYEMLVAREIPVPAPVATAFCYGISSETRRLGREGAAADRAAYLKLLAVANLKKLSRIEYPRLTREFFTHFARVLQRIQVYRTFACADLNDLPYPDFVAEMADFLLRIEGITWSLCVGRYGGTAYVSIRSTNPRGNASSLIKRILPKQGRGGGHAMIAGGQVPVDPAQPDDYRLVADAVVDKALQILHFKGAQPGRLLPPGPEEAA